MHPKRVYAEPGKDMSAQQRHTHADAQKRSRQLQKPSAEQKRQQQSHADSQYNKPDLALSDTHTISPLCSIRVTAASGVFSAMQNIRQKISTYPKYSTFFCYANRIFVSLYIFLTPIVITDLSQRFKRNCYHI